MADHEAPDKDAFDDWLKETFRLRGIGDKLPSRLYKFLSSESKYFPLALDELLLHSRLYLSSRTDFNDPFDSRVSLDIPDSPEFISQFVTGFAARNPGMDIQKHAIKALENPEHFRTQIQERLDRTFDNVGIYSFSESISHPLMWAHYACSHRGIALVFRHAVEGAIGAFPIRYQDNFPRSSIGADGIEVFQALAKGPAWEYEREWRLVESNRAHQWIDLPASVFNGVVFGASASQKTFDFVLDLIKRRADAGLPHVHVYRARAGASFDLDFFKFGLGGWKQVKLP